MADATTESPALATAPAPEYTPKKPIYCGGESCFVQHLLHPLPPCARAATNERQTDGHGLVCTLPPEYCEFGGTTTQCEEWLSTTHPSLHQNLYSAEAVSAALATLSIDARKRAEKDSAKKAAKAALTTSRAATKRASSTITIKRIERNKRKFVTSISGLEAFADGAPAGLRASAGTTLSEGELLKRVAKELGKRFACGGSVSRNAGGTGDEVVVQGDVCGEVEEWIAEGWEGVPEGNVVVEEVRGKKAAS
ncbi:MAG: Translation machinery-associated protein 22 [Chrysothrix sp. TS-e1954]|nr:MAG: Translation machinery-associated protein 22 [Chrysothrix sp. TS-e1954]